jgi:hypothetical protein
MNGAGLLYAFPPNSRGYCGRVSFGEALKAYLTDKADVRSLEKELERFPVHHAYLTLIAKENGLSPFDIEVVRAFWTGNPLLENVSHDVMRRFISEALFGGKNRARAERLSQSLPEGALPHHNLNALFINFVTDKAERSMKNIDSCCVTWAKVLSVSGKRAKVVRDSISYDGGFKVSEKTETVSLERTGLRMISPICAGDFISVHWGLAIEKLSAHDKILLERYSKKNILAMNHAGWMIRKD